jgi:hypothetical protein
LTSLPSQTTRLMQLHAQIVHTTLYASLSRNTIFRSVWQSSQSSMQAESKRSSAKQICIEVTVNRFGEVITK